MSAMRISTPDGVSLVDLGPARARLSGLGGCLATSGIPPKTTADNHAGAEQQRARWRAHKRAQRARKAAA